jgi:hypothetical protein
MSKYETCRWWQELPADYPSDVRECVSPGIVHCEPEELSESYMAFLSDPTQCYDSIFVTRGGFGCCHWKEKEDA